MVKITNSRLDLSSVPDRLQTFERWSCDHITAGDLSENGFFFKGTSDTVECFACHLMLEDWQPGDNILELHTANSPDCPFLKRQFPQSTDNQKLHTKAEFPEYSNVYSRLETFIDWPSSLPISKQNLAEAGFFYTGKGDRTQCFHCGEMLKDWTLEDEPWEEHAYWFPQCQYINIIKGEKYVEMVKKARNEGRQSDEICKIEKVTIQADDDLKEENTESSSICKVCFNDKQEVCFLPCGHIATCAKCGMSMPICPICRRDIDAVHRIYHT